MVEENFQKVTYSDALKWLFSLPPLYLHHGWRKFSKLTFLDALKWLFSPPFYLHHGWRKFSKITYSDASKWLFSPPFYLHLGCSRMGLRKGFYPLVGCEREENQYGIHELPAPDVRHRVSSAAPTVLAKKWFASTNTYIFVYWDVPVHQFGLDSVQAAPAKLVLCAGLIATLQHGFHTGKKSGGREFFITKHFQCWLTSQSFQTGVIPSKPLHRR